MLLSLEKRARAKVRRKGWSKSVKRGRDFIKEAGLKKFMKGLAETILGLAGPKFFIKGLSRDFYKRGTTCSFFKRKENSILSSKF